MRLTTKGPLRRDGDDRPRAAFSATARWPWLPSASVSRSRCRTWSSCSDKLRRHELVESTRGPGGGYSLGRGADAITVADIIVAVDEPIDATGCAGKESCMGEDAGKCMTHDLWASLNSKMIEYLDSISLKKLVDDQLAKGVSISESPIKRAISSQPVVKPIKVTAPNSVFALGNSFSK